MIDDTIVENMKLPYSLKDIVVIFPLLGSALALSFDIGYFFGVDIHFFTLFSITEHFVFALEAVPFAAIGILAMLPYFVLFRPVPSGEWISKRRELTIFALILATLTAISVLILFFLLQRPLVAVGATAFSGCAFVVYLLRRSGSNALFPFAVSIMIAFSFVIGIALARDYLAHKRHFHTVVTDRMEYRGQLIRSGDKILLFFDIATNAVTVIPWKDITTVVKVPGQT